TLCNTISPLCGMYTWQNRLLCCPGGLVLSMVNLNASSLVSLVIVASGAVTFGGRPTSATFAEPVNGVVCVSLQNRSVVSPCPPAARSIVKATNGAAPSMVASCDETHIGPLPKSDVAITAVFHLRTVALGAAFIGSTVSVCPSAMTAAAAEPTPGGLK